MSQITLSSITRYPIKSAAGESLQRGVMDEFGLLGDRRWMIIDESGTCLTQRQLRAMALLAVEYSDSGLQLHADGDSMFVESPKANGLRVSATVWEHSLEAPLAADSANSWLSDLFKEPLRLVYCPDDTERFVEEGFAPADQRVAFSDGYPLLLITEASLTLLNDKLDHPVPMNRFRPNLVLSGATAHAEDGWRRIRIGEAVVDLVKPCARCTVPAVIQETAGRDPQILEALMSYRKEGKEILFGMNAIAQAGSSFQLGDQVDVLA
ncbi:MAG: MOSC N-terminal beta barrel domain-containing protein [Pseudomonadota bacterium]